MYTVIHKEELEYFPSNSSLETDLKSEFRKIGQKQAKAAGIDKDDFSNYVYLRIRVGFHF